MWTGQVARTERRGTELDIIIHFTDGDKEYDRTFTVSSPPGDAYINDQITSILNQLNSLDVYQQAVVDSKVVDSTFTLDPNTNELTVEAAVAVDPAVEIKGV